MSRYTCRPLGFVEDRETVSIVTKSHTDIAVVVSVGCVVASVVDVSVVSIVSLFVVIMVVPFIFTSHTDDHVTQAVSTYAHIHTIVPANRLL